MLFRVEFAIVERVAGMFNVLEGNKRTIRE